MSEIIERNAVEIVSNVNAGRAGIVHPDGIGNFGTADASDAREVVA